MADNDEGPWDDDPFEGHWGDDPPFGVPVFVCTHHVREPLELDGGTTFTSSPTGWSAPRSKRRKLGEVDPADDRSDVREGSQRMVREPTAANR